MKVTDRILAGRTSLLWDQPFFGALAVQMNLVDSTDDPTVDTMAVDGKNLFFHPPFVESLAKDELIFVLAHEVMHNALEHHIRRGSRDPDRWNRACDYAINGELVATKIGRMPKCGLIDPRFTGMAAEEIYRILDDEEQGGGGGAGGKDPGGCGGVRDACSQHDQAAIAEARAEMQTKVKQAVAIAKAANEGTIPGNIKRLVDQLTKPVVDWRSVLRRFIDESLRSDFSWAKPNRRFLPQRLIMPGIVSDGMSHLVVGVDSSGSVFSQKVQTAFASEVNGAFGDGGIDKITVIYADAVVKDVQEFEAGDELNMRPEGGGGTRFSPTFAWIKENAPDASAVIYFTDMECTDYGEEPDMPVMWAVYGDSRKYDALVARAPFGEAISLSDV